LPFGAPTVDSASVHPARRRSRRPCSRATAHNILLCRAVLIHVSALSSVAEGE
jgi:hypothetical protein